MKKYLEHSEEKHAIISDVIIEGKSPDVSSEGILYDTSGSVEDLKDLPF